jgi:lysophospholipase L1-like esterase
MKKLSYILLLGILLFGVTGCFTDDDESTDEKPFKIAVLGDSISAGCNPELSTYSEGYAEKYGWAQMITGETHEGIDPVNKTIYDINENITWENFAITGSKASEWNADSSTNTTWKAWDNEFQNLLDMDSDLVIIYIGANDIMGYIEDGNVSEVEWNALRFDIEGIIDQIKLEKTETKILLVGYYDLFDGLSQNLSGTAYSFYASLSSVTQAGNVLLADIATEKGIEYLSVEESFMHHCYGRFLGDTEAIDPAYITNSLLSFDIHPVIEGHNNLYSLIIDKLETMLEN